MFNRFFRRKPQAAEQQAVDYAALFNQLMDGLAAGWSAQQLKGCLAGRENDAEFLQWLYRYDQKVLKQTPEQLVIERLVQWGAIDCGAVGRFVKEIGERALQQQALQVANPSVSMPSEDSLLQQGHQAYQQGKFADAIVSYDQVLASSPNHHVALNNKGASLAGIGRFKEAIAIYDQAIALKPDSFQVIYRRGNALRNTGRFEEAIVAYDAALGLKPDLQEALNNKGTALAALKRFEDAIAAYDGALSINPKKYTCLNNKGMMLQQLGRLADAIVAYDAALAINPKYSRARQNKAHALQSLRAR